jgi:DNA mismatch repair protein MutS2
MPGEALVPLTRSSYPDFVDEHAIRVLEFRKVLEDISREAAFSLGREKVLAIEPFLTLDDVATAQSLTAEMVYLHQAGIDVPFAGARDIHTTLQAAAIGQVQDPGTLSEASNALKACVRARRVVERVRDRVPRLGALADRIGDFFAFTDAVEQALSDRGEVLDSASDALATARRELRSAQSRLDQRAQAAMQDAIRRGIVQEGLLTERNGRKVIPVKAEMRSQMSGIVHDVSSSGATVFIEPMGVVETGNEVRELQLAEEREIRRVLQRLTDTLGSMTEDAALAIDTLAELDALHAKVRYGRSHRASREMARRGCEPPAPRGSFAVATRYYGVTSYQPTSKSAATGKES